MAPLTCHKTILPSDCAAVHRVLEPDAAARVVVDGGGAEGGVAAVPLAGPPAADGHRVPKESLPLPDLAR